MSLQNQSIHETVVHKKWSYIRKKKDRWIVLNNNKYVGFFGGIKMTDM